MNDKDFNLAILMKLYEIATAVWAKMAKVADYGSYSAKDVCKGLNTYFCFSEEQDKNEQITIKHETFECSFPLDSLFNYITIFERLSGIGRNAKQFVFEESGELLGSVTLELTKGMQEVCNFVAKDEFRPVMNYIVLDADNNRLVATDGKKVIAYPIHILERSGDLSNFYISPKQFALMCKRMKKNDSYLVTAKKEKIDYKEYTKVEFDGVTSKVEWQGKYPNWKGAFSNVSNDLSLQFGDSWNAAKKFIKTAKKDGAKSIIFRGVAGNSFVTLEYGGNNIDVTLKNTLVYDFKIGAMTNTLKSYEQIDTLYLGVADNLPVAGVNSLGIVYLFQPGTLECEGKRTSFVGCKREEVSLDIDLFPTLPSANNRTQSVESTKVASNTTEQKEERTEQKNESAKVVDAPAKVQTKVASKATLDADSKKFTFDKVGVKVGDVLTFVDGTEVIAAEDNKVSFCDETFTLSGFCKAFMPDDKRTKSNAYRGCDYFYKDGVKLGKLLKEYQKTLAATLESKEEEDASAKVETLNGTTEEDIPRWERKFNEVWADKSESVQIVVKNTIKYYLNNSLYVKDDDGTIFHLQVSRYDATNDAFTIKDANDLETILWVGADRQRFSAWYHEHLITEARYNSIKHNDPILKEICKEEYKDTLDDAPSEQAQTEETTAKVVNLSSASVETTERTITSSAKDIAAERKELAQNANNVVCDVGILAKVVSISLGVPPECAEVTSGALPTTEPPNLGVRLVDVGCKLSASDVGSYSLVGGKVIHTLPLPPPRTKETSYNRKLLYHLLIRKQRWKQYHSVTI